MQESKPYISTGLRNIFAIVSSQISFMMEPSHEISPPDMSFLSSLSIIYGWTYIIFFGVLNPSQCRSQTKRPTEAGGSC